MKQIDFLNTVRVASSQEYQNRIPLADRSNLEEIYATILDDQDLMNEFYAIMIKVAKTIIHDNMFENPLAMFHKGELPYGGLVEEMGVDILNAHVFDPDDCNLCVSEKAPLKAFYQSINRKDKYQVRISYDQLRTAFKGDDGLSKLLGSIVNKLRYSNEYDEFVLLKEKLGDIEMTEVNVPAVQDADTLKDLVRAIKQYSLEIKFPKRDYNKAGFMTHTELADQRLIIRKDIWSDINVEYLATLFNKNLAEFTQEVIIVDDFGSNDNCYAILCDKDFIQYFDNLRTQRNFENGANLSTSYWFHIWQTYLACNFLNAIRFRKEVVPTGVTVTSGDTEAIAVGEEVQITLTTAPVDASYTQYDYKSSAPAYATVSDTGVIKGIAAGSATITVTNKVTNTITATISVTVA